MVYTYTGKNSFALQNELKRVVSEFQEKHGDFAIERLDASEADVDTLLQSVQGTPFLSSKKLVVITNISTNSQATDRIEELLERSLDENEIYLVDQKLDKRKSYFKFLKKQTKLHEFKDMQPIELPKWIEHEVADSKGKISRKDAQLLVDRVGQDQMMLSQEIRKLLLHGPHITEESIKNLTDESLQSSIFTLLDEAFRGNGKEAIKLYSQQRRARVEPVYIVAMLTWQLQNVALAIYADPQTESTLQGAGVSPYNARKSLSLARNISKRELQKYVVALSELDGKLKSSAIDADAAIELYLLKLTTSS
jgi:DNA polymerase-3 subunit delta